MDKLSLIGGLMALGAVILGVLLEGGALAIFVNPSAFLIVLGGTVGAVLLQTPRSTFKEAVHLLSWVFHPPALSLSDQVNKVKFWSGSVSQEGIISLQEALDLESDEFARKGLSLLIEGTEPQAIRSVLETDILAREHKQMMAAKVFSSMGGYAPTIGIMGAVIGLIQVVGHLGEPESLGLGIATAFIATLYGVGFANLIFLPIGNKLKALIRHQLLEDEVLLDGLVAIAEGEHSLLLEKRLEGYLHYSDQGLAKAS